MCCKNKDTNVCMYYLIVCVCVCVRERQRGGERERGGTDRQTETIPSVYDVKRLMDE